MQKISLLPTKAHILELLNFARYSWLGYSTMRFLQALQKNASNT
jgi:hypothetical protein